MQVGLKTVLSFAVIFGGYLLLLYSVPPINGNRLFYWRGISIGGEAVLLFGLIAAAFCIARISMSLEIQDDWRRGLLKLGLTSIAILLFASPPIGRGLLMFFSSLVFV